jgi:hypothetical protein
MGIEGLYLAKNLAELPSSVIQIIKVALISFAVLTAEEHTASLLLILS